MSELEYMQVPGNEYVKVTEVYDAEELVTQAERVEAFKKGWASVPPGDPGDRTRAGLLALHRWDIAHPITVATTESKAFIENGRRRADKVEDLLTDSSLETVLPAETLESALAASTDDTAHAASSVTLDPNNEFESVLIDMVETHRRKAADYARDGDEFSNFTLVAEGMGIAGLDTTSAIEFMVRVKLARLTALRSNGRPPANEGVLDTYLDLAVYSALLPTYASRS